MQIIDVINQMLSALSYEQVDSINDNIEVRDANRLLTSVSQRIQSIGWAFNTDTIILSPDKGGEVLLPSNALAVDPIDRKYVRRSSKIYDRNLSTYIINAPVKVKLVSELSFKDLPQVIAAYIADEATLSFVSSYNAESTTIGYWRTVATKSRIHALDYERSMNDSSYKDMPSVAQVLTV